MFPCLKRCWVIWVIQIKMIKQAITDWVISWNSRPLFYFEMICSLKKCVSKAASFLKRLMVTEEMQLCRLDAQYWPPLEIIYYLLHNKMSRRVWAAKHSGTRLLRNLLCCEKNAVSGWRSLQEICMFSEQCCLGVSVPGSEKCWGLNWSPQLIFPVPDMNTLVGVAIFFRWFFLCISVFYK